MATSLGMPEARAWKPITHVALARRAIEEAKANGGRVSIFRVDFDTGPDGLGKVKRDGAGHAEKIGDFAVDPRIWSAITRNEPMYYAGVLGPDAYPDIASGQMRIHPPGGTVRGPDVNENGPGTDPWLEEMWARAWSSPGAGDVNIAFMTGFLGHAAGDMYGHTFINNYAGGIFDLGQPNMVRHIMLEGYVAERTDLLPSSMFFPEGFAFPDDVANLVAQTTIDAPGAAPNESGKAFSLPAKFAALRAALVSQVDTFRATEARLRKEVDDATALLARDAAIATSSCVKFPPDLQACATAAEAVTADTADLGAKEVALQTLVTAGGAITAYETDWIATIDQGLVDWVKTSHQVATNLFYNADGIMKITEAELALDAFKPTLFAMATGAPTAVQNILNLLNGTILGIRSDILKIKDTLSDFVFQAVFHKTLDQLRQTFEKPHLVLDQTFASNPGNPPMTLAVANHVMGLSIRDASDINRGNPTAVERFDPEKFPAAWNTITMIKLSLMSAGEVDRLVAMLHPALPRPAVVATSSGPANAMLGFASTIDGSNQWNAGSKMVLARDCAIYRQVFMKQQARAGGAIGEEHDPCSTSSPPPLTLEGAPAFVNEGAAVTLRASAPVAFTVSPPSAAHSSDGHTLTLHAPANLGRELRVGVTATATDRSGRRASASFVVHPAMKVTAVTGTPPGALKPGASIGLVVVPDVPVTWRVVSGGGAFGDPPREALFSRQITAYFARVRDFDARVAQVSRRLAEASCKRDPGCVRTERAALVAAENEKAAFVTAHLKELLDAERGLTIARGTYHAPTAGNATSAVVEAMTFDATHRTAAYFVSLAQPHAALTLASAVRTVKAGSRVTLRLNEPVPMAWTIETHGPPGSMGQPAEQATLEKQLDGLHLALRSHSARAANVPPAQLAAFLDTRAALLRENAPRYGAAAAKLVELRNTYVAPARVTGTQVVTLRGTALDGSGRTVIVTLHVTS